MSVEIEDQSMPRRLELDGGGITKDSNIIRYCRSSLLSFADLRICRQLPDGIEPIILRQLKLSYTRDFLLSLRESYCCKRLPRGFDRCILGEYGNIFNCILEHVRTPGGMTLLRFKGGGCVSSPPQRLDSGNSPWGRCAKWESNFHSIERHESVPGRPKGHLSQDTGQNVKNFVPLENDASPKECGCLTGSLAPKVPENGLYRLNKSDNPYRPPCSYKFASLKTKDNILPEKANILPGMVYDDQEVKLSEKQTFFNDEQNETYKSVDAPIVREINRMANLKLAYKMSDNLVPLVKPPDKASELLECIKKEHEVKDSYADKVERLASKFPDEDNRASSLRERSGTAFKTTTGGLSTPLLEFKANSRHTWLFTENKSPILCSDRKEASHRLRALASPSCSDGKCKLLSAGKKSTADLEVLDCNDIEQSIPTDYDEIIFIQYQPDEGHRILDLKTKKQDSQSEKPCLSTIECDDSVLNTPFNGSSRDSDDYGITGTNYDMFDSEAAFDNAWAEISSLILIEPESTIGPVGCNEGANAEVELCLPDEDSLIAIDHYRDHESELSSMAGHVGKVDLEVDICLPDEESLITVDDLIAPQYLITTPCQNAGIADKLTSNNEVNLANKLGALHPNQDDQRSSVSCVLTTKTSKSHLLQACLHSHHSLSLEKPSFHTLPSHQAQVSSQSKFVHPSNICLNLPLHCHSCTNVCPPAFNQIHPAKVKGFDCLFPHHPPLKLPIIFNQQPNYLEMDSAPTDPFMQMACYKQGMGPNQSYPYQGFGMANSDFGDNQALCNSVTDIELGSKNMHPFLVADHGQIIRRKQVGTAVWHGK